MSPSTVCPAPVAHSPQDALKAYLDAKKNMPGLTPAAWRKAAAQQMGLDYDTYLALWKVHKGVASRLKMVPQSVATKPAAASSAPSMGLTAKPVKSLQEVLEEAVQKKKVAQSTDKAVAKSAWQPSGEFLYDKAKDVSEAYKKGLISLDDAIKHLDDLHASLKLNASPTKSYITGELKKLKNIANTKVDDVAESAAGVIQTAHGPLTHDLAQSVYKKMKTDMPGATPAVWRHEAAKYLGVDYNDYLKAWKKPTTAAQKVKQTPASKLPPNPNTPPLSPSSVGKYANKDISPEELKDELAKAYGPGANKNYISLEYDDVFGTYKVQFPNSILKTEASKKAVVEQLKLLGLDVKKISTSNTYMIKSPKGAQVAAKNAAQIKQTGTYTLPNGKVVLDIHQADLWTNSWWKALSQYQQKAWKSYTASGYRDINHYWRFGKTKYGYLSPDEVREQSKILRNSMQKTTHDFTVFRGTDIDINQFIPGEKWTDKGFYSTAIDPGKAWTGVQFEVVVPKGTRGMYIGKKSSHPTEAEFLFDRGTEFRVMSVDKSTRKVVMVAIPK